MQHILLQQGNSWAFWAFILQAANQPANRTPKAPNAWGDNAGDKGPLGVLGSRFAIPHPYISISNHIGYIYYYF